MTQQFSKTIATTSQSCLSLLIVVVLLILPSLPQAQLLSLTLDSADVRALRSLQAKEFAASAVEAASFFSGAALQKRRRSLLAAAAAAAAPAQQQSLLISGEGGAAAPAANASLKTSAAPAASVCVGGTVDLSLSGVKELIACEEVLGSFRVTASTTTTTEQASVQQLSVARVRGDLVIDSTARLSTLRSTFALLTGAPTASHDVLPSSSSGDVTRSSALLLCHVTSHSAPVFVLTGCRTLFQTTIPAESLPPRPPAVLCFLRPQEVGGDIIIDGTDVVALDFPSLKRVGGSLFVSNNARLLLLSSSAPAAARDTTAFPTLESVRGDVVFSGAPPPAWCPRSLSGTSPAPPNSMAPRWWWWLPLSMTDVVHAYFFLYAGNALSAVSGFQALREVGGSVALSSVASTDASAFGEWHR